MQFSINVSTQLTAMKALTPDNYYYRIWSGFYLNAAYYAFVSFCAVQIVSEKENKIREGMTMMGLPNGVFW